MRWEPMPFSIHRPAGTSVPPRRWRALVLMAVALLPLPLIAQEAQDAGAFVEFVTDNDANCVRWEGQMILVHSTHPDRAIKVWMERYFMGKPTGDRSRSELAPHGEPEKLGCSRLTYGTQEWRVVKAEFLN